MIALLQRVAEARVEIDGRIVGRIGTGLLLFVCAEPDDTEAIADKLVDKVLRIRVFADAAGKMNLDLAGVGGELLVVSQFTLLADTARGRRPSFEGAAPGEMAEPLVALFVERLRQAGFAVATGRFGAHMKVELLNDGPVTLVLDF